MTTRTELANLATTALGLAFIVAVAGAPIAAVAAFAGLGVVLFAVAFAA